MKNCKLALMVVMVLFIKAPNAIAEFMMSDKVKIYYTDSKSKGEVVVLIHGYSMSSSMWHETGIVEKLSMNYRVVTIDSRGHGKSDKPLGEASYGPKVGGDVINLLNALEIEKAHLVGYSMGAYVVGRLLVTHPDRVHSATLASGFFPSDDADELHFQEETAKEMEKHGKNALASMARGWRYDAVTDQQIAQISVPMQAVFGSEEINEFFALHKKRLEMPKSALPIVIIEGADHDSNNAAVLQPKFVEAVNRLIDSTKM